MSPVRLCRILTLVVVALMLSVGWAAAQSSVVVQCPGSHNGDAIPDPTCTAEALPGSDCFDLSIPVGMTNPEFDPDVRCMHLSGGDGFITMADVSTAESSFGIMNPGPRGTPLYFFSFSDISAAKTYSEAMAMGRLGATFPAPKIVLEQGTEFYLTLTNVGMMVRADLFDEHTVHFHGFPNAAPVFDGVPDSSISISMGASLTYYYKLVDEGTFMYHCHVEATEHMQMGMLGNLYVKAAQNRLPNLTVLGSHIHSTGDEYLYSDGDGSTRYDVDYPIQIGSLDGNFHHASYTVQALPFADMKDTYPLLNGRGYAETLITTPLTTDPDTVDGWAVKPDTQAEGSLITATAGQKVALRLSNLNVTQFNTLTTTLGVPMLVVGIDAKHLGVSNYYETNAVTLGGGQSIDVILDTTGVAAGTYFVYTTNMYNLSNNEEDFGGMMTEIIIS